jgi:2Fe-2S ferredoxin
MASITYVLTDGSRRVVDVPEGTSVMLGAVNNNIKGIDGECGGCLSCATCHVYVDEEFLRLLPAAHADELDMLEGVAAERRPNSRLGCQIPASPALDGLVVTVPERQSS